MSYRIWMYQLNPARAHFVQDGKEVAASMDVVRRELATARVGPWPISFGFNKARKGDLIVLKMGGRKPVGVMAVGRIDQLTNTARRKEVWFRPHRKATEALLEMPIPVEWVRANLPKHMGNLVDVTKGKGALGFELRKRGVAIESGMFRFPLVKIVAVPLPFPEQSVLGPVDPQLDAEGRKLLLQHVVGERSRKNRDFVLASREKPYACDVCGFQFAAGYGSSFGDYIEVHHLKPVSQGLQSPKLKDFALLCANCHAVAHWKCSGAPRSVQELQALTRNAHRSGGVAAVVRIANGAWCDR